MNLNTNITELFNKHAPVKYVNKNKKNSPLYITHNIRQIIHSKNKAYRKYMETKNLNDQLYYVDLENYLSYAIRKEKDCYMKFELERNNNNPKFLWKKVRNIRITSKINYALLDEEVTGNDINNFLVNVGGDSQSDDNTIHFYKNNK